MNARVGVRMSTGDISKAHPSLARARISMFTARCIAMHCERTLNIILPDNIRIHSAPFEFTRLHSN